MMKKYFFAVVMCCITFSSWAQKQLVVLHKNDSHSCVIPLNPNIDYTAIGDGGGFRRRVIVVISHKVHLITHSLKVMERWD